MSIKKQGKGERRVYYDVPGSSVLVCRADKKDVYVSRYNGVFYWPRLGPVWAPIGLLIDCLC